MSYRFGELNERDYYSVRDEYESNQALLADYSDEDTETLIAVVSKPGDTKIDQYCDEHWPELGMPKWALRKFWEIRSGYKTNSAVEDAHNKAFEDADLESVYHSYLKESDEAEDRLEEAVQRLENGENLSFVCFEQEGERCHRHILVDVVEERLSRRSKFDLSS